jgi:hypothetical protein
MNIKISNANGPSIDLELRGGVNIVRGGSATGKTYFYKLMEKSVAPLAIGAENLPPTLMVDLTNIRGTHPQILAAQNMFIVIDKADPIFALYKDLVEFIRVDHGRRNTYLIFARHPHKLHVSPNYMAEFIFDGKTIKIEYLFSVSGWY